MKRYLIAWVIFATIYVSLYQYMSIKYEEYKKIVETREVVVEETMHIELNVEPEVEEIVEEPVEVEIEEVDEETIEDEMWWCPTATEAEYEELARIIMCEAGGEDFDGKILVGNVIMNRVKSNEFPNDIISVIRQKRQFSPVSSGKIDRIVPTNDCYLAAIKVLGGWDISQGALYFESCSGDSWHSRNLTFLFKHGGHRFYK